MRTTLTIDDDIIEEVRLIAAAEGRSLGSVISDLARQALAPTAIRMDAGFPAFDVEADAPVITAGQVARALDDE